MRHHPVFSFGSYLLDPDNHLLESAGEQFYLRPKTFKTLCLLLEKRNRVVTREELLDSVWEGTVVSESVVSHCIYEIRRVLDDDSEYPRYIRTISKAGYMFIGEVTLTQATGGAPPAPDGYWQRFLTSHPGTSPLVERDQEISNLALAIEQLASGRGGCHLFAGERGIGKSRLLAEAGQLAIENGLGIACGTCYPRSKAHYLPIEEILKTLVMTSPGPPWKEDAQPLLDHLAVLLPDWEWISTGLQQKIPMHSAESHQVAGSIREIIVLQARWKPTLLLLENLHWADEESLFVLEQLAVESRNSPILILGTLRNGSSAGAPLLDTLESLVLNHLTEIRHLEPLSSQGVATMWNAQVGFASQALAHRIWKLTRGLPLFIEELAEYCRQTWGPDPALWLPEQIESLDRVIPEGIILLLRTRLNRVSEAGRDFLGLAAVAGPVFNYLMICRALGKAGRDCLGALEELLDAKILTPADQKGEEYEISMPFLRRLVLQELSPSRRAWLDQSLGATRSSTAE